MKNSTYNRRSQMASTVKKSHAMIPVACRRRNARQVVADRRGAGPSPWATQDGADGGGRDLDAEALEFALMHW